MVSINTIKKPYVIGAIVVVVLVIAGFASCSDSGNDKDKKSKSQSSILVPNSTNKNQVTASTEKRTTIPTYVKAPFSVSAQQHLYSLPTVGEIDDSNPGTYTSPRYEAILGGDTSSGIPISELDNPKNSDLDEVTFNIVRTTAIAITKAQITGEGAANYPSYFNAENQPGTCVKFETKHAGATSLPIPNDNRWIKAIIFWKATCGSSQTSFYSVNQQTSVFFTVDNGSLTPRQFSEVPKSNLNHLP